MTTFKQKMLHINGSRTMGPGWNSNFSAGFIKTKDIDPDPKSDLIFVNHINDEKLIFSPTSRYFVLSTKLSFALEKAKENIKFQQTNVKIFCL